MALAGVVGLVRWCADRANGEPPPKAGPMLTSPGGQTLPTPILDSPSRQVGSEEPGRLPSVGGEESRSGAVQRKTLDQREQIELRIKDQQQKTEELLKKAAEDRKRREEARRKRQEELRAQGIDPSTLPPPPPLVPPPQLGPAVILDEKK